MDTRRILRTLVLALLWGMAVSTWVAIGHHMFGLPDVGLPSVILAVTAILAWPARNRLLPDRSEKLGGRVGLPHTGS